MQINLLTKFGDFYDITIGIWITSPVYLEIKEHSNTVCLHT